MRSHEQYLSLVTATSRARLDVLDAVGDMASQLVPRLGLSGKERTQARDEAICDLAHEFLEALLDSQFMTKLVDAQFLSEEFRPFPQVDLLLPFLPDLRHNYPFVSGDASISSAPVASGSGVVTNTSPPHVPPRKRSRQDLSDPIIPKSISRESSGLGNVLVPSSSQVSTRVTRSASRGGSLSASSSRPRATRK